MGTDLKKENVLFEADLKLVKRGGRGVHVAEFQIMTPPVLKACDVVCGTSLFYLDDDLAAKLTEDTKLVLKVCLVPK